MTSDVLKKWNLAKSHILNVFEDISQKHKHQFVLGLNF